MSKKQGFTIIEIIVCIALISTLSIGIVIALPKNDEKKLKDISNKILEAASVFVEVEKDENNNSFLEEVSKGAKGVKIPVSTLVDKGYITQDVAQKLYDLKNVDKPNGKSYFVMFLSDGTDYCDQNQIVAEASWMMNEGDTIYLCKNYPIRDEGGLEEKSEIEYLNQNFRLKYSVDKFAVSKEYKDNLIASGIDSSAYVDNESGLFSFLHNIAAGNYLYTYYRGAVSNNYVKLGTKDGEELLWRIVWLRDDNKMKLTLDTPVPLTLTSKTGDEISIKNKKVYYLSRDSKQFIFVADNLNLVETEYTEKKFRDEYYNVYKYDLILPEEKYMLDSTTLYSWNEMYKNNNFYMNKLLEWYNSTNLSEYDFLTQNSNFCINDYYREYYDGDTYKYFPSSNFDCAKGEKTSSSDLPTYNKVPNYYSSKVGFLTYGDLAQTGIPSKSNLGLENSGHYLINPNYTYPLQDIFEDTAYSYNPGGYLNELKNYFVNKNGMISGILYKSERNCGFSYGNCTEDQVTYKIKDNNNTVKIASYPNYGNGGSYLYTYTFVADSLKPAIIIDLNNYKLSNNNGTLGDEYIIIPRT